MRTCIDCWLAGDAASSFVLNQSSPAHVHLKNARLSYNERVDLDILVALIANMEGLSSHDGFYLAAAFVEKHALLLLVDTLLFGAYLVLYCRTMASDASVSALYAVLMAYLVCRPW